MNISDEEYKDKLDLVEFKIPQGTRRIGKRAFAGCENLRSISIPNSVTVIEEEAFSGCKSLQAVVIPNKVRTIRNDVFRECHQLKTVTLPQGLRSIGDCAFFKCFELDNLIIPSSVKRIGEFAFDRCDRLEQIDLPSNIQIAQNAFGVEPVKGRLKILLEEAERKSKLHLLAKDYLLNQKKRKKCYSIYWDPEEISKGNPALFYFDFTDAEVTRLRRFLNQSGFDSHYVNLLDAKKLIGKNRELDRLLTCPGMDIDDNNFAPVLDLDHYCYPCEMTCLLILTNEEEVQPGVFSYPLNEDEYLYLLGEILINRDFNYNDLLIRKPALGKKITEFANALFWQGEDCQIEHKPFVILFDQILEDAKLLR